MVFNATDTLLYRAYLAMNKPKLKISPNVGMYVNKI